MEKKITKVQMFAQIREAVADNADMVEFIDHEIELLNKKSANKKPTKAQAENEVLKDKIVEVLGTLDGGATATEILNADEAFTGMSNQKITSMLKLLKDEGRVVKTVDKKKSIFSIA